MPSFCHNKNICIIQLNIVTQCGRFTANQTKILVRNRQLITLIVFFIIRYDYMILPYDFGRVDSSIHANASGPVKCHLASKGTTEAAPPPCNSLEFSWFAIICC